MVQNDVDYSFLSLTNENKKTLQKLIKNSVFRKTQHLSPKKTIININKPI